MAKEKRAKKAFVTEQPLAEIWDLLEAKPLFIKWALLEYALDENKGVLLFKDHKLATELAKKYLKIKDISEWNLFSNNTNNSNIQESTKDTNTKRKVEQEQESIQEKDIEIKAEQEQESTKDINTERKVKQEQESRVRKMDFD